MQTKIRVENWDVDSRLSQLGLKRKELVDVVKACVTQHAFCSDNDPPNARGFESWRWGVRKLREIYRAQGWEKDDTRGFSTLVNRERKIRVAVMNADGGAGTLDEVPQNRSRKGAASEEVAAINMQLELGGAGWAPLPEYEQGFEGYTTWHLCIYISGDVVRAELSRLHGFQGGYFTECFEKIILLGVGDWEKQDFRDGSDDLSPDFAVEVTRK